jgi:hypothetical protein
MEVFNQLKNSWYWMMEGSYILDRLDKEWTFPGSQDLVTRLRVASFELQGITVEQCEKIRGFIQPKYIRIGTLKEVVNIIIEVRCFLEGIFNVTEWPFVKKGVDGLKKAEDIIKHVMTEEVKNIKEMWKKERKEKENQKRKEKFDKMNENWIKIQNKFRTMGHPDWMPEEEKKKKKGILEKVRIWWKNWRR